MTLQSPKHADDRARVMHNLSHHRPTDTAIMVTMAFLRVQFQAIAETVCNQVPQGRERSMALTAIEDAFMYSIAGLARAVEVDENG